MLMFRAGDFHQTDNLISTSSYVPVSPIVKARLTKPSRYGELSMLECSVLGFYPQEVRVSWLRDGLETTIAVTSTDTLANGDWRYQLHSYLEFRPQRGESVSCMVEHPSLDEPLEVVWGEKSGEEREYCGLK